MTEEEDLRGGHDIIPTIALDSLVVYSLATCGSG